MYPLWFSMLNDLDVSWHLNCSYSSASPPRCQLSPQWSSVHVCIPAHWCVFFLSLLRLSVCQILPKGVVSVIGPASSPASGSTVSHICGEKEVRREDKTAQECHANVPVIMCAHGHLALPSLQRLPYHPQWWMNAEICCFFSPLPIKWTCIHFLSFIPSLPVCLYH